MSEDGENLRKEFVIQLVSAKTGMRTEPFVSSMKQLYETLQDAEKVNKEDLIIVVAAVDGEKDVSFVTGPVFTVQSFLEKHKNAEGTDSTAASDGTESGTLLAGTSG